MTISLGWLAVPLLALPWETRQSLRGTMSPFVLTALGLAALDRGIGTLSIGGLHAAAMERPEDAWFIAFTLGVVIAGGCLLPGITHVRRLALGIPLLAGSLGAMSLTIDGLIAGGAGAAIGAIPWVAGLIVGRLGPSTTGSALRDARSAPPIPPPIAGGAEWRIPPWYTMVLLVAIVSAFVGPLIVTLAALVVLASTGGTAAAAAERPSRARAGVGVVRLCAVAIGIISVIAWAWFALTIAGTPWITWARFAVDAPVSPAASVLLGFLGCVWVIAFAASCTFESSRRSILLLPVLATVVIAWAPTTLAGLLHWQSAVSALLVVVALAGASAGRPVVLLTALMIAGATRPEPVGVIAAYAAAVTVVALAVRPHAAALAFGTAIAAAAATAATLQDQLLLAVVLGFGLAIVFSVRPERVALPVGTIHL